RPSWVLGVVLVWSGELERARSVLQDLYERAVEAGDGNVLPYVAIHLSRVAQRAGDYDAAERYIEEAEEAATESSQGRERTYVLATKALLDAQAGRIEAARARIDEGLRLGQDFGVDPAALELLSVLGSMELSLGDPAAAVAAFDRLIAGFRASGFGDPSLNMRFHADAIEALIELGRLEQAESLLDELEERGRTLSRPSAVAAASRSRALLVAARGEPHEALKIAARARVEQDAVGEPLELGRTLLVRGVIARRAKQRRLARASLLEAIEVFEQAHADIWARRTREELRRVSGRAGSGTELTPAEERVASLVGAGLTNREVAARLFVTEHTVEAALVTVYSKLGIRSRVELAIRVASPSPERPT
ncbi:MAG: LuxR C-terminal-related transcriptional regulator, partial [Actinomycetota bacterium]